jgi:predicted molibdopterin-dependent oxidoreductase YjgC
MGFRVENHAVLGAEMRTETVTIIVDGKPVEARKGEYILAALLAEGIIVNRYTHKLGEPRGLFCGIGQCTDCAMVVDGHPNVRTCVTEVRDGMVIETQLGVGNGFALPTEGGLS